MGKGRRRGLGRRGRRPAVVGLGEWSWAGGVATAGIGEESGLGESGWEKEQARWEWGRGRGREENRSRKEVVAERAAAGRGGGGGGEGMREVVDLAAVMAMAVPCG